MNEKKETPGEKRACTEAGCHDFSDPVIIRHGSGFLWLIPSHEIAFSLCRRCGATIWYGFAGEDI